MQRSSRGLPASLPPLDRRAMMSIGNVPYESWIAKVRECTAADAARAQPRLPGPQADLAKRTPVVSIAGRLVPTGADCTLMDCGPGNCCNGCEFLWVVIPRRDCPGRKLRVSLRDPSISMRGGGMDCAVTGYGQDADWVVVTGRIGGIGDVVADADICRLPSLAMLQEKDRLTDADYDRLTRSARPDQRAGCAPSP